MQKTIRLHRQHDMDLISLYRTEGFKFSLEMKRALRSCATGEKYRIHVPNQAYKCGYVKRSILLHVTLNEDTDSDIIRMLKDVRTGQCNSFMKAAFRNCLDYIPVRAYGKGSGFVMSLDEAQNLTDNPLIPEPERERYEKGNRPPSTKQYATLNDNKVVLSDDLQKNKDKKHLISEKSNSGRCEYIYQDNIRLVQESSAHNSETVSDSEYFEGYPNNLLDTPCNNGHMSDNKSTDPKMNNDGLPFDEKNTMEYKGNSLTDDPTVDDLDDLFTQMSMLAH